MNGDVSASESYPKCVHPYTYTYTYNTATFIVGNSYMSVEFRGPPFALSIVLKHSVPARRDTKHFPLHPIAGEERIFLSYRCNRRHAIPHCSGHGTPLTSTWCSRGASTRREGVRLGQARGALQFP